MINDEMCDALNRQLNAEVYSAYLYFAMAANLEHQNLGGFGHWLRIHAQEELTHAVKFADYILERGGRPQFGRIEATPSGWDTPLEVFDAAYRHELTVSQSINALVDRAASLKDHATLAFLQWFVNEQVEEEATFEGLVQQLRLAGDSGAALLMIDRELSARVFTPPAAAAS